MNRWSQSCALPTGLFVVSEKAAADAEGGPGNKTCPQITDERRLIYKNDVMRDGFSCAVYAAEISLPLPECGCSVQ